MFFWDPHRRISWCQQKLKNCTLFANKYEYLEAMREIAMSFIDIRLELQSRGARFERFREMVTIQLKSQVDGIQTEQGNTDVNRKFSNINNFEQIKQSPKQ